MRTFSNSDQLRKFLGSANLYLFGAGNICHKTIEKYSLTVLTIIDNNRDISFTEEMGFTVLHPTNLEINDYTSSLFLICSTSILEIESQLLELGVPSDNIAISPLLNQVFTLSLFETQAYDFLVASGLQNRTDPQLIGGGGLYRVFGDNDHTNINKISNSPTHSICKVGDLFYCASEDHGIALYDNDLNIINSIHVEKSKRPHGITASTKYNLILAACSYSDSILVWDLDTHQLVKEIPISRMFSLSGGTPQHHCNDITVLGDFAYVSCFSVSGNWKRGLFDGGLIVISLSTLEVVDTINKEWQMPHSICVHNDNLLVLDSLRGDVLANGFEPIGSFAGFTRGFSSLANGNLLIGQSKNRNFTFLKEKKLNISLDNSVIIFEPDRKLSRTILFPSSISEIHSIFSLV